MSSTPSSPPPIKNIYRDAKRFAASQFADSIHRLASSAQVPPPAATSGDDHSHRTCLAFSPSPTSSRHVRVLEFDTCVSGDMFGRDDQDMCPTTTLSSTSSCHLLSSRFPSAAPRSAHNSFDLLPHHHAPATQLYRAQGGQVQTQPFCSVKGTFGNNFLCIELFLLNSTWRARHVCWFSMFLIAHSLFFSRRFFLFLYTTCRCCEKSL